LGDNVVSLLPPFFLFRFEFLDQILFFLFAGQLLISAPLLPRGSRRRLPSRQWKQVIFPPFFFSLLYLGLPPHPKRREAILSNPFPSKNFSINPPPQTLSLPPPFHNTLHPLLSCASRVNGVLSLFLLTGKRAVEVLFPLFSFFVFHILALLFGSCIPPPLLTDMIDDLTFPLFFS